MPLIGIDAFIGLFAEEPLERFDYSGHSCRSTDDNTFIYILWSHFGRVQRLLAGINGTLHQILDQGFELGSRNGHIKVLGPFLRGSDEGQVDLRLGDTG